MEYQGYYIEESTDGLRVYKDRESWIRGDDPLCRPISMEVAENWINRRVNEEGKCEQVPINGNLVDYIETLPFMPEQGEPVPESVMKALYPSQAWELMQPPVSDYGREVVEETAKRLKEFMTSGNFVIGEKFSEEGWSSEDITYLGTLTHTQTSTTWLVQINTIFEWRKPNTIITMVIMLYKMPAGKEPPDDVMWDGELNSEEGEIADKMLREL